MLKKIVLLGLVIFCSFVGYGQILKIQPGISLSSLNWKIGENEILPYSKNIIGYSIFAGANYLDKKYFNLSTNVGVIRKGGTAKLIYTDNTGQPFLNKESFIFDYISLNTLVDLKLPVKDKIFPYLSIGPRIDYLFNYSKELKTLKDMDALSTLQAGLLIGAGVNYKLDRLLFGLRADKYLNFNGIAKWPASETNLGGNVKDNTFTFSAVIGYRLKK